MKLEMINFPVTEVKFSKQTSYNNGVLEINKEELVALALMEKRIASADLEIAFPGEQTRIVLIRDVVEPRVKVSGPGCVFPGILGPVETVGEGRTHRLSGVAIVTSAEYRPTIPTGTAAQTSGLLDMWGPGAELTPLASTINIVPTLKLVDGVTELEAHAAIQLAECRIAQRLAETTIDKQTGDKQTGTVEDFELFEVAPSLPRVVYILGCLTTWHAPHSGVALYGFPIRESLPTLIHPNEFLDGALTTDARRGSGIQTSTWGWMNHPMVLRLLREHGKRLNFLGVILQRTRFETEMGKQVTAECTSQMARLMGADGVIVTRIVVSGNNFVDTMLTVQACVKKGIKTVLMTPEWDGKDGTELPFVFSVPEATAIVTTGSTDRELKLPAPTKVISAGDGRFVVPQPGDAPIQSQSELTLDGWGDLTEGIDWWGRMNITCREY